MILAEFIESELDNVDIVFTYPKHLEKSGAVLSQPLLWIMELPSETLSVGCGKETGSGKAVKKRLHFYVYIIAENNDKYGMLAVNKLSGKLEMHFLENGNLLGAAKLRKAEITPPADVLDWANSNFVGARHGVFVEVLLKV